MSQIEKVLIIFYEDFSSYYKPTDNTDVTMLHIDQILTFIKEYVALCDPPVSSTSKIPQC